MIAPERQLTPAGDLERSLLDQLLTDSRLYRRSKDYRDLLDFVSRLRNFAPFNAMLLQLQKPGLRYAASASDWKRRFGRLPREGARPLLILWPFGPVALVYDVIDTEGDPLPEDVDAFFARGSIDDATVRSFKSLLDKKRIHWHWLAAGDGQAGYIRPETVSTSEGDRVEYRMFINENHSPAVQFTTLGHELGHLFLGHLGKNEKLNVPDRSRLSNLNEELEAESVAYVVCKRNGVDPKSETYLAGFVQNDTTIKDLDIYQVMRAAGQVEAALGLSEHTRYEKPPARQIPLIEEL